MKIAFYYVDINYINYLKQKEIEYRGFTTVPNIEYKGKGSKPKFVCGVVMELVKEDNTKMNYYVPVSSFHESKEDNIVVKIESTIKEEKEGQVTKRKIVQAVASLRFNYMFPVPKSCLKKVDFQDRTVYSEEDSRFLDKEYRYIKNKIKITNLQKQAQKTYKNVLSARDKKLLQNSCAFEILEKACLEYIENQNNKDDKGHEY